MQFTAAERLVYQTVDGRFHDPLAVRRTLLTEARGRFNDLVANAYGDGVEELIRIAAEAELAKCARVAFKFPAFDENTGLGATETECLHELTQFLDWLEKKGNRDRNSATS